VLEEPGAPVLLLLPLPCLTQPVTVSMLCPDELLLELLCACNPRLIAPIAIAPLSNHFVLIEASSIQPNNRNCSRLRRFEYRRAIRSPPFASDWVA